MYCGILTICEWNLSTKMLHLSNVKRQFQLGMGFEWESSSWNWNVLVSATWRMYDIRIFNCNHQKQVWKPTKNIALNFAFLAFLVKSYERIKPYNVKKQKRFAITFLKKLQTIFLSVHLIDLREGNVFENKQCAGISLLEILSNTTQNIFSV